MVKRKARLFSQNGQYAGVNETIKPYCPATTGYDVSKNLLNGAEIVLRSPGFISRETVDTVQSVLPMSRELFAESLNPLIRIATRTLSRLREPLFEITNGVVRTLSGLSGCSIEILGSAFTASAKLTAPIIRPATAMPISSAFGKPRFFVGDGWALSCFWICLSRSRLPIRDLGVIRA